MKSLLKGFVFSLSLATIIYPIVDDIQNDVKEPSVQYTILFCTGLILLGFLAVIYCIDDANKTKD